MECPNRSFKPRASLIKLERSFSPIILPLTPIIVSLSQTMGASLLFGALLTVVACWSIRDDTRWFACRAARTRRRPPTSDQLEFAQALIMMYSLVIAELTLCCSIVFRISISLIFFRRIASSSSASALAFLLPFFNLSNFWSNRIEYVQPNSISQYCLVSIGPEEL